MYFFEISTYENTDFFMPIRPIQRKKVYLLEGTINLFENLNGQKWKFVNITGPYSRLVQSFWDWIGDSQFRQDQII